MSHAFVYDAVHVNKIVAISLIKLPSYAYAQITAGQKLNLPIHDAGAHCKPNSNSVD